MPSKPHKPSANPAERTDPLADAADRLSSEVRCLRDVLDEIREDVSWMTRNGLPIQPVEHVNIKRMARDVNAADWNERLVVERTPLHPPGRLTGIATPELRRLTEDLQSAVEALMDGQIGPILKAVDEVQTALMDAMQRSQTELSVDGGMTSMDAGTSPPLFPPENPQQPCVRPRPSI